MPNDPTVLHLMNLTHHPWKAQMYLAANSGNILTNGTTWIVIPFDTVLYDPNSNCTTGSSAHYVVPVAGFYSVSFAWAYSPGATATVFSSAIGKVASPGTTFAPANTIKQGGPQLAIAGAQTIISGFTSVDQYASGDNIQIGAFNNAGGPYAIQAGTTTGASTWVSIHFLSPA